MSRFAVARRFARLAATLRPAPTIRRTRLAVQALEDRAVPANSIFLADRATPDEFIDISTVGDTTTISTTDSSATLSLATIEAALTDPAVTKVIVTTAVAAGGTDAEEAGDIFWDGAFVGDQLDLTGAGIGKTLTFKTIQNPDPDNFPATGNILLSGVEFLNNGSGDQISLVFDSSDVGGSVTFGDMFGAPTVVYTAEAVLDLTVNTGFGDFIFWDDGNIAAADAGGVVSVTAGIIDLSHTGGLTAGASLSLDGTEVRLADSTGLYAVSDLSVVGTTLVTAGFAGFESETGHLIVTAPDVTLTEMILRAAGDVKVTGDSSVTLSTSFFDDVSAASGNVEIKGGSVGLSANMYAYEGEVTISGTDVSGTLYVETDNLVITGTTSVALTDTATDVRGVTVSSAGSVDLTNTHLLLLSEGDAAVSGTSVNFNNSSIDTQDGKASVTGTAILLDDVGIGATGNITITGPVTLGPGGAEIANGPRTATIAFSSTIDGTADLVLDAGAITIGGAVGGVAPLNILTIEHGNTSLGNNNLSAVDIALGIPLDPLDFDPTEATLGGGGVVTGDVLVGLRGNLAPGGLNTIGTMTVRGNVTFATPGLFGTGPGGDFAVDFGPGVADQLKVVDNPGTLIAEGRVDLSAGARLGGGLGSGQLTPPGAVIIDSTGLLTGEFTNAPVGKGILVGTDAIMVDSYTRLDGTGRVEVIPVPAVGPVFKGIEDDGTTFTATLTGGGTLVPGRDPANEWFLVVRDARPTSRLTITTRANASDNVITLGAGLLVNGPLASLSAAKVNIGGQFRASGPVGTAVLRDFIETGGIGIDLGGTAANRTSITARNISDDVKVGATLTGLRVAQHLGAPAFNPFAANPRVSAAAIGTLTARSGVVDILTPGKLGTATFGGDFNGAVTAGSIGRFKAFSGSASLDADGAIGAVISTGGDGLALDVSASKVSTISVAGSILGTGTLWNVDGGINTISAGSINGVDLEAGYLGVVTAKGNLAEGLSGDIRFSTFTLDGNDGTAARNGIRKLTAKGTVDTSLFDVRGGNVGTFTVGRFHFSQLYLNYTPHDFLNETFDTGGSFGSTGFRLGSFKTTAVPLGDPDHPLNWAFRGSEIAADTIGTVLLSGLQTDNGGNPFGIKARTAAGSVKVKQADDPSVPLNVNLVPSNTPPYDPIAGDFFLIDE
jgi:hypothetical protein